MNIGIFSESYEPVVNGVTVSILTLTRALKELGHQIYVFAPGFRGHTDRENETIRFPSVRTWVAPDYPLAAPFMPGLKSKIRDLKLDVIHTHTPFMLGLLGSKMGKRLGIPVVSTNHTLYTEYVHYIPVVPKGLTRNILVSHMRRYYNKCDGVIVPSKPVADLLREFKIDTPIHVVPTGIALDTSRDDSVRAEIRKEYGIPQDARVILYIGRIAKEKNLVLLLKSFERLADKHKDCRLFIVGGGPYLDDFKAKASKMKSSDKMIFTGPIPRDRVAKYYSVGDIFGFPSTTETQGLAICEALIAGLPCVAVNAGGAPEMLVHEKDSFLCADDLNEYTARLDLLLSDENLMKAFQESALRNSSRFCPKTMAARMVEVYQTVCK